MTQQLDHGEEFTTPVISNNPKDVAYFHAFLDTLEELGFYYDEKRGNCSGQINIGLESFNSPEAVLIFIETFCNAEEVLFHISNKEGQLIRQSVSQNSKFKPVSGRIKTREVSEDLILNELISMFDVYKIKEEKDVNQIKELLHKRDSICLRGGEDGRYRFEIRIPNGSAHFEDWKENILLYGKMVEFANRCADILRQKKEITKEDENLLLLREELRDDSHTLEEELYILMDMIFLNNGSLKKIYMDRFYVLDTIIQKGMSKGKYERHPHGNWFGKVEFLKVPKRIYPMWRDTPNSEIVEKGSYNVEEFDNGI